MENIPGMDPTNAVSLYGNSDATDEFPVLKAFQQYIDAEQAKARKRMVSLAILFGVMMAGVVAVFVTLIFYISQRNQTLNDRLVEFAMRERGTPAPTAPAAATAQPQPAADTAAFVSMFSRLDALQKQMEANQQKSEKAVAEATERALKAEAEVMKKGGVTQPAPVQPPSHQKDEIATLKALLELEKEKLKAEKEKVRQAELEAYRRKHYPECYATPVKEDKMPAVRSSKKRLRKEVIDDLDSKLDDELKDDDAIKYFDETDDDKSAKKTKSTAGGTRQNASVKPEPAVVKPKPAVVKPKPAVVKPKPAVTDATERVTPKTNVTESVTAAREIQLNVNGQTSSWSIPND